MDQETSGVEAPENVSAETKPDSQGTEPTQTTLSQDEITRLRKAEGDLKKIQDYFRSNQKLVDFAYKYAEDPRAQKIVDSYYSGETHQSEDDSSKESGVLSGLDEDQKAAVANLIDAKVQEAMKGVTGQLSQLQNYYAQSEIEKMERTFTKNNGYPLDFSEVKGDIAEMLNKGEATTAKGAFLQIVGERLPGIRSDHEKAILDAKRQASMSSYTTSQALNTKPKDRKVKGFAEALALAEEQIGHSIGDKLNFGR